MLNYNYAQILGKTLYFSNFVRYFKILKANGSKKI